ncbi:unnamed protein product [Rotaria magnacalcarata]|nr:unnamed protein product [Rotaria magnacalcarata]
MLSTSLDHTAASVFIEGYKPNDDYHGVLFEIECNTNLISRPFAEVSKKSYFPDEQEVLFMPGGAFAVNDIQLDQSNQLYVIKLRLCNDQEIQKGFYKKNIFKGDRDAVRELFSDMGTSTIVHECSDLDQLYNHMIKLFSSDKLIELDYLKAMGSKNFEHKNFQSSIHFFERSLALKQEILSSDDRETAELHYSIAESYYRLKNYHQVIDFCHKALNFNSLLPSDIIMAHSYLGLSYLTKADWNNVDDISLAKYYLQKTLDIDSENQMLGDAMLLNIYQALADINEYYDDFNSSIDYRTRALDICENNEWTDESTEIKENIQTKKLYIIETEQSKT